MNDYLWASHEAIFDMVHKGEPGQSAAWARCVTGVSRDLGSQLESLREHSARISSVWSDGVGSVRLTADLNAVIDYLQALADGLRVSRRPMRTSQDRRRRTSPRISRHRSCRRRRPGHPSD